MVNKGYTKKEVLDVLFESEEEKERRRVSAIVTKAVDAIRLENVREFLAYQQLATWRRMNGFDRVANALPLTPEQYTASLWSEVDALKEAISMPAEDTVYYADTVQHCSPISQTPEPPSSVYVKLENTVGTMDPGLKESKSSSVGTGLRTYQ